MMTADFNKLSLFIYNQYGINLPPVKKTLLESRLQKRLHALGLPSFQAYCDFVFSPKGQQEELIHMVDLVTTNKTDFFREPAHFDFLLARALPEFISSCPNRNLKVWSAGCSSGEEPYTLALVLSEFARSHSRLNYSIFATDISTQVLEKAVKAIYSEERVAGIPFSLRQKYFLRSKDTMQKTVRVVPAIRAKVQFERLNFMEDNFDVLHEFDIIFCRNVLIYFDKITQEKVIHKLCLKLRPRGYFFLGHSESITGMEVPLLQIKPTVFRKV